tara:strand:- start:1566 stop:1934 length:369 start_codon:yes stop_codon:yes gene_type:complete
MGCRGTIEIWENGAAPKDKESPVVLYTHWGANDMLSNLKTVLKRKERWNDPPYLSRMIFCQMIKGEERDSTGYGIMTNNICDAEKEIVVDCDRQEIIVKGKESNMTYTFSEFVDYHQPPNCS